MNVLKKYRTTDYQYYQGFLSDPASFWNMLFLNQYGRAKGLQSIYHDGFTPVLEECKFTEDYLRQKHDKDSPVDYIHFLDLWSWQMRLSNDEEFYNEYMDEQERVTKKRADVLADHEKEAEALADLYRKAFIEHLSEKNSNDLRNPE